MGLAVRAILFGVPYTQYEFDMILFYHRDVNCIDWCFFQFWFHNMFLVLCLKRHQNYKLSPYICCWHCMFTIHNGMPLPNLLFETDDGRCRAATTILLLDAVYWIHG